MKEKKYIKPTIAAITISSESMCSASDPQPDEFVTEEYYRDEDIYDDEDDGKRPSIWEK